MLWLQTSDFHSLIYKWPTCIKTSKHFQVAITCTARIKPKLEAKLHNVTERLYIVEHFNMLQVVKCLITIGYYELHQQWLLALPKKTEIFMSYAPCLTRKLYIYIGTYQFLYLTNFYYSQLQN